MAGGRPAHVGQSANHDDIVTPFGFVPDALIGEDPEPVEEQTKTFFLGLCDEMDFDHVLFAHGKPLLQGGRRMLRGFCES